MDKVLIVDNEKDVLHTLSGLLRDEGYQVEGVYSEKEAIEAFANEKFDFALIDIRLHGEDTDDISGLGLAAVLRSMSPETLIFLMSGYPLSEPYLRIVRYVTDAILLEKTLGWDKKIISAITNAKNILQERKQKPTTISGQTEDDSSITAKLKFSRLSVSIAPNQIAFVRSQGAHVAARRTLSVADVPVAQYQKRVDSARYIPKDLRFNVKDIGSNLWRELFSAHSEIQNTYLTARAKSKILSLLFEGPREFIRLPIEFMFSSESEEYLVLLHPLARFVNGTESNQAPFDREFFKQSSNLKILLIASNTPNPHIPGVDLEVAKLERFFLTQKQFAVDLEVIPTEKATIEFVREKLKNPDYDVIHYAGHGSYNSESPEESTLSFWSDAGKTGEVQQMRASEFHLLSESRVRLFYLSCCWGAASGDKKDLLDDDFLGVADAIVRAGVPTVLGYRWPVTDAGAPKMALAFYRELLNDGRPDVALWKARRELAAINRNDLTWLSPILIHQV
ncbi:MAG: CHAT domain-containing protein [Chloroflexi bacterium]|nr:CHAT domain-containing protein [Chloroflexota bacterium]